MADLPFGEGARMGQPVVTTGQFPLDGNSVVVRKVDLSTYPTSRRYLGRIVFVQETGEFYALAKGITNDDWLLWGVSDDSGNITIPQVDGLAEALAAKADKAMIGDPAVLNNLIAKLKSEGFG